MLNNLNKQCCMSGEERIQLERSKRIDRELTQLKRRFQATQKIVLLGAGESGKSTFLKQMQIIHGTGFTDNEINSFRTQIYENILRGVVGLVNGKTELQLAWRGNGNESQNDVNIKMKQIIAQFKIIHKKLMDDREQEAKITQRLIHILPQDFLNNNLVELVLILWNDLAIQEAFTRRREFPRYFVENVPYFIQNIHRIAEIDYIPNEDDILRARRATTSINEVEMMIKNVPFRFVDVGGQRTQRQKWHQCFSDVTAILFLASCSEYDECLREDSKTNRLEESCKVFETLINYKYLKNVEFILFLNKYDLLKEKIRTANIKHYCNDFNGNSSSLQDVERYMISKFSSLKQNPNINNTVYQGDKKLNEFDSLFPNDYDDGLRLTKRHQSTSTNYNEKKLYTHFTTAIDTNNIKTIFEMVRLMIFEKNCRAIMLS